MSPNPRRATPRLGWCAGSTSSASAGPRPGRASSPCSRSADYAVLHERRLVPSERGRVATAFLEDWFGRWVDYGFTAAMEADLDRIAEGSLAWRGMLEGFWAGFRPALDEAGALKRGAVREAVEERLAGLLFAEGEDGSCPACGSGRLELRLSRYGPFVGCADYPDCGYRRSGLAGAGDGGRTRHARSRGGPRYRPRSRAQARTYRLVRAAGRGGRREAGAHVAAAVTVEPGAVDLDLARQPAGAPPRGGKAP